MSNVNSTSPESNPFILNIVALYPVKHCNLCLAKKCDAPGCGKEGWECLVDQEVPRKLAEERKISTIVQAFACRTCRGDAEQMDKLQKWVLEHL